LKHPQWQNPDLALEQEAMKIRQYQHGIAINHALPTLERRYLHRLFELPLSTDTTTTTLVPSDISTKKLSPADTLSRDELAPLMRWRDSTQESRRVKSEVSCCCCHYFFVTYVVTKFLPYRSYPLSFSW
jgi:hypothetical protein